MHLKSSDRLCCEFVFVLLIALFLLIIVAMGWHWEGNWIHAFAGGRLSWVQLSYLGAYMTSVWLWPRDKGRKISRLLSAGILFGLYLSLKGPMYWGDRWSDKLILGQNNPALFQSSILSHFVYHIVITWGLDYTLVASVIGFVTALSFFALMDTLFSDQRFAHLHPQRIAGLLYVASGVHLVFTNGFVEMTYLGLPFLLLGLRAICRYFDDQTILSRHIIVASILLMAAAMCHGQYTFLLPSLPLAIILKQLRRGSRLSLVYEFIAAASLSYLAFEGIMWLLEWSGYDFTLGHAGGGDGHRFTAMHHNVPQAQRFILLSLANAAEVGNIVLLVSPLFALIIFAMFWQRERLAACWHDQRCVFFGIVTLAYLGFAFLWNFDLGFPVDLDLMTTMGMTVMVCIGCIAAHLYHQQTVMGRRLLTVASCCSALYPWGVITQFLLQTS